MSQDPNPNQFVTLSQFVTLNAGYPETTSVPALPAAEEREISDTDPLPAEGAPHAYVAVLRTFSPHADRPEWNQTDALVVPEWEREHLAHLRGVGYALIPIGPDGDTGTRAIGTEEIEVADFQAACKSACEQRDAALEQLAAVRAIATGWAGQAPDYDEDTEQQIDDGCALLRILDGTATVAEVSGGE